MELEFEVLCSKDSMCMLQVRVGQEGGKFLKIGGMFELLRGP